MATTNSSSGCRHPWTKGWIAAAALAAGCAQITEPECRTANWYQIGEQDGNIWGMRPRIDQLPYQCSGFGVVAGEKSEKDYMTGWVDGYREWTKRVHSSDCCGGR